MILTEEQRRELAGPETPRAVDPETGEKYVLIHEALFERIRRLIEGDFGPSDMYPAIDRAFAAGWNDSKMDDYDRYEELTQ